MKICLIAEGCYPYIAGGVSSWVQMLIEGMPEHEFIIVTIGAEYKMKGNYKYSIPSNVTLIDEHFIDEFFYNGKNQREKKVIKLSKKEIAAVNSLVAVKDIDWETLFELFNEKKINVVDFLMSEYYLDAIKNVAQDRHSQISFLDVFWSIRSMLLPLLSILTLDILEADIYHTVSTGYAGIVGSLMAYRTGKPLIVTEHGIYTREREEEILKAKWVESHFKQLWIDFFSSMSLQAYKSATIVTSLFGHAKELQQELGADENKCRVIPNGIECETYGMLDLVPIQRNEFAIGAIVRVVPIKDIKTLLYAFEAVKREIPNAVLYIIGPTDENEEYYEECKELINLQDIKDVVFTGRVVISEFMEKLDVVVLSSVSEGQPFVLLEAMASHRPIVSTNVGCCKSLIEGENDNLGQCGYVVPVMNPTALARSLIRLGNNRETLLAFGDVGYKRVNTYYTKVKFLQAYKNLYEEVFYGRSRF